MNSSSTVRSNDGLLNSQNRQINNEIVSLEQENNDSQAERPFSLNQLTNDEIKMSKKIIKNSVLINLALFLTTALILSFIFFHFDSLYLFIGISSIEIGLAIILLFWTNKKSQNCFFFVEMKNIFLITVLFLFSF